MAHAFDIHNELGRLPSEKIFKDELAYRCKSDAMNAWREMPIRVSHDDFTKSYYIDLVVNSGVIYELKVAKHIAGEHERQLIHYLLLLGQHHGNVINFRSASVEKRFVSTSLTIAERRIFTLNCQDFLATDDLSARLETVIRNILNDWGAFLEIALYREAVHHFLGGEENLAQSVELRDNDRIVGRQPMRLLNPTTSLHLSAVGGIKAFRRPRKTPSPAP